MIKNDISKGDTPLFSVVVPAFNSSRFIVRCIESVLGQSCSDFELILVDDGSRDETLAICKNYARKDSRVRVIHKENGGHTSARNAGLKISVGQYILFLDSDDWLNVDVLKLCATEINSKNPDVIIYNIYNTGTNTCFKNKVMYGYYNMQSSINSIVNMLIMNKDGNSAFVKGLIGKVFRKEIIIKNQLDIPNELRIGEDAAAFVASMLDSCGVSVISDAIYYYYVREGSVSHSADEKAYYRLPFMIEYYKYKLSGRQIDFSQQFDRYIVAQLYTATLLVMRSGKGRKELNRGLESVLADSMVSNALKKAKFNMKGYKFLIKKFILQHRLWWLVGLLDK